MDDKLPGYDQLIHDYLAERRERKRRRLETQLFERWLYEYYTPRLQEAHERIAHLDAVIEKIMDAIPSPTDAMCIAQIIKDMESDES